MTYANQFFSLKCSGDVMNSVGYLGHKPIKEISETMGVMKYVRRTVLKNSKHPMVLYDLCAGNALTSVLAVHLFPFQKAIAVDKLPRDRNWKRVERFEYHTADIFSLQPEFFEEGSVIVAVHACTNLARRVVELYNTSKAKYLILMPCCHGRLSERYPELIIEKLGKYILWAWDLAKQCNGHIVEDLNVLSPKNCIVTAVKGNQAKF